MVDRFELTIALMKDADAKRSYEVEFFSYPECMVERALRNSFARVNFGDGEGCSDSFMAAILADKSLGAEDFI